MARSELVSGYDPQIAEAECILSELTVSGAVLCFLKLGARKKEILTIRGAHHVPQCALVSIRAGLDFVAGTQRRILG